MRFCFVLFPEFFWCSFCGDGLFWSVCGLVKCRVRHQASSHAKRVVSLSEEWRENLGSHMDGSLSPFKKDVFGRTKGGTKGGSMK
jgi:hypothetical protein